VQNVLPATLAKWHALLLFSFFVVTESTIPISIIYYLKIVSVDIGFLPLPTETTYDWYNINSTIYKQSHPKLEPS